MILSRPVVVVLAIVGLAVVLLANAHLVYVAFTSQPTCVAHSKVGENVQDGTQFSAAQSAC